MSRIFIIYLLFVADFTVAQSNFIAGSITKLNGETLTGKIDYREWLTTPQAIRFQPTNAPNEIQTYTPHELAAFKINHNQEEYHRAIVGINNEPIEDILRFESAEEAEGSFVLTPDTVFLLTLIRGNLNLFMLTDKQNKQHFFIQKRMYDIKELIYRIVLLPSTIVGGRTVTIDEFSPSVYRATAIHDYRKQLAAVTEDCPAIQSKIDRALYTYNLVDIVKEYNESVGSLHYIKPKDRAKNFFYGYVGASQSFFSLKDSYNKDATSFASDIKSAFGFGFEWGITRSINKLSVNLEANYSNHTVQYANDYVQPDGGIKNVKYNITLKGWRLNALLKYVLYTGKWQPYVRGGIGRASYTDMNYLRTGDRLYADRNLVASELYLIGSGGLKYKTFFLETRYETGNDLNRTTGEDLKTRRLSVVAGCALLLNK